jgi:O-antigen/teichoic acid export membrane protein
MALLAAHREAATLRVSLISLVVLGGLLALLLPVVGWIGACWAVLGAETVQAGLLLALGSGVLSPASSHRKGHTGRNPANGWWS